MKPAIDKQFSMSPALCARASSSLEALLGGLPVDDVPDSLEVLGLAVLVLEAIDKLAFGHSHLKHHDRLTSTHAPKHQLPKSA